MPRRPCGRGLAWAVLGALLLGGTSVWAGAIVPGFSSSTLPANDDGSTGLVGIGFSPNFYGTTYSSLYVNNNGNVTFDAAMSTFTPFDLYTAGRVIIAPFFADVDTRGSGSGVVTYGTGLFGGRTTFGVNWIDVGYYSHHTDKLNSFQLLLVDRSDIAAGDFDIIFNYDKILWETGDASSGSGGLGGFSARVGYSDGTSPNSYELPGSAVNGAFLDGGPASTALIHNSLNDPLDGRYIFTVRGGTPTARTVPEPTSLSLCAIGALGLVGWTRRRRPAA